MRALDYPDYFVWSQRVRIIEVRLYCEERYKRHTGWLKILSLRFMKTFLRICVTSGKVKWVSKKQQKKGLNVFFAAVFWPVTQCSPEEMSAHICITSLSHCVCGLFAVCRKTQSPTSTKWMIWTEFVSNKRCGVHSWWKTGVTTFDGHRKRGPKASYRLVTSPK